MRWTLDQMPRLDGRTAIVTGASSGVGLATARGLARAGAHVVLAVRSLDRGRAAARAVRGSNEVRSLDLADLASVREFAASWRGDVDVLVNNAGVAMVPAARTVDGFEMQFGTNHLGHFALTNLLLPHITGRVVSLASGAHRFGTIDFDDPNFERRRYQPVAAYGQSKLANLLFVLELQRRLAQRGSPVRALAAHPGYTASNLGTHGRNRLLVGAARLAGSLLAQGPATGALPSLYAATQDLPGASYVGPDGWRELRGHPTLVARSLQASDADAAKRLWDMSRRLTGIPTS
ncbi:oxidoreductase [Saccharopolyspora sp. TS4A08]|uniref:Oxidoreductase n=1 Tax=Saccharopolyspora ipomoeae TaxID=3042027 RepID=A0ABT6PLP3_9PSEU|nr:oxidoreductase [Saccharopolyspora sp. TS4A08]MDI2028888.1 oxidoreductase [Saccharopolyspora sp. TS4A08]